MTIDDEKQIKDVKEDSEWIQSTLPGLTDDTSGDEP